MVLAIMVFGVIGETKQSEKMTKSYWKRVGEHNYYRRMSFDSMSPKNFERFVAGLYEEDGYRCKLTPATGDFGADVIARQGNESICIQVKKYSAKVGPASVREALAAKAYYECNNAAVVTNSFFTPSAKKLAGINGVQLIDREKLYIKSKRVNKVV